MDDRDLLELVAKACGFQFRYEPDGRMAVFIYDRRWIFWNPLENDGDCFRLVAALKLDITYYLGFEEVCVQGQETFDTLHAPGCTVEMTEVIEKFSEDMPRSTRRAIVRAAAEIGRQIP